MDPENRGTVGSFVVQCSADRLSRRNGGAQIRSIMKVAGRISATVVVAVLATVGFAGPASADDISGTYSMVLAGGDPVTWTIRQCVDDPAQQPFIPCVRVAETGGKFAPWEGEAHLSVGYWTMFVQRPDAISCDDGSTLPSKVAYSWNAVTLSGWLAFYFPGGCGGAPAKSLAAPFTLTKTGAAGPAQA
jgi:hypothetical protein